MQTIDARVDPNAMVARRVLSLHTNPATSLTNRATNFIKPGFGFRITDVAMFASTVAGAVAYTVWIAGDNEIVVPTTLAKHSTPEQFTVAICRAIIGGVYTEKAAATALTFSAAHVVSASKFGCILVQMNASGTISTKVAAATQAYDTATAARNALPAADSGKIALGYIAIAAKAATWTANTDDLTDGSDLTTATFNANAATVFNACTGTITPVAFTRVVGTLSSTLSKIATRLSTKGILVTVTTDGSGALTNGSLVIGYRPYPLAGE